MRLLTMRNERSATQNIQLAVFVATLGISANDALASQAHSPIKQKMSSRKDCRRE